MIKTKAINKDLNMTQTEKLSRWTKENAIEMYNIENWSAGYFNISNSGEVEVIAQTESGSKAISLIDIISGAKERGLGMPLLLRIENLLGAQITKINESFIEAIKSFNYQGAFRGVYPIKVNQQQQVVQEVARFGQPYHHGLEAGSKAELMIAITTLNDPEACIICNGYKDNEFIDLGLYVKKMGFKCFFVLEMPGELDLILERSRILGIEPNLGVRIKLSTKVSGNWSESSGERSLFGLTTNEIIEIIDRLKNQDKLHCLQLLHYHLGSQIPNIKDIRSGVSEACRIYSELVLEGAMMGYLDLGGGLAVDYDGSKTNFPSSCNYTMKEYCDDIIDIIISILNQKKIQHPTIITESGRATVAYHSILLFNVVDTSRFEPPSIPENMPEDMPEMIKNCLEVYHSINLKNLQECYNDAIYYKDELNQLFKTGQVTLRQKAIGEIIFWNIIQKISQNMARLKHVPIELDGLDRVLSDIYYCNFSIFQSLPDFWAVEHLFPVMPIHRLNEAPNRSAILADITCDCDGKIDKFIDLHDVRYTLPVHELKVGEEYYIGIFLVGAYQETLGDLHNLLGDPNIITIRINDTGDYDFVSEMEGDSVAEVLSYVEYDPKALVVKFRETAEKAVRDGIITVPERLRIMQAFDNELRGYTYYER